MKIISDPRKLQTEIENFRKSGLKIGFVPTMGALHRGHITLVENSVRENDVTVVSIFVNPTQFNNADDLKKYPRDLNKDAELLSNAGCNLVFAPEPADIYSDNELNERFSFDFEGLDKVMEGKFRPGHFNGVVQIVSKLFTLVEPHKAYFGEKDFQQLAIIHLMVRKMGFSVEIVDCKIVREESGLALSSRNERLTAEQKVQAARISAILFESVKLAKTKTPEELHLWVLLQLEKAPGLKAEYFEIANSVTLQTLKSWDEPAVGCVAVFCGDVRLIDNVRYN
ncbi:MAG: pantoate--beta-alanine ligase [Bacteroidia bacterium]|nr:pantoate--beta-alanine ligase [Paludibacter sp.]MDD3489849.1 pantoate--beta-alanine ligase [Paludibacter sp.]NCB68138.1 pantoate--beta-alanine ligase [Bacteroidia bacterium]